MNLTGSTILITGGGSGIGRGLAEALHKLGNTVIIAGRRQAALDETTAANPGMHSLVLDIADPNSISAAVASVTAEFPGLSVLINNAGIMKMENLHSPAATLADSEAIVTTNLLGPIRMTTALMPHLLTLPAATVINVTSGLAFIPLALTPTYCATKAALHSYTLSLRYQLKDTAVEVLEIAPPWVATELMGATPTDPRAMPLDQFIAQTMDALVAPPENGEVLVPNVMFLRNGAQEGQEFATFNNFNDAMTAAPH